MNPRRILTGAGTTVEVSFDQLDRPVVRAANEIDAAYGLGWCVATHRRAHMDVLRRRAHGTLAAIAGPDAVESDRRQRRLGMATVAQECLRFLSPPQRRLLESYSAGVNEGAPEGWSIPWKPVDSIAVAQLMFDSLTSDGTELRMVEVMRRTLPPEVVDFLLAEDQVYATAVDGTELEPHDVPLPRAQLRELLATHEGRPTDRLVVSEAHPVGSNAWAVSSGEHTLLASDMHLELTWPSIWYAARLVTPQSVLAGVTVPGLPVMIAGTNGSVAWGVTRMPGDTVDLREVPIGTTPGHYLCGDEEEPFTVTIETIEVAGAADVTVEVVGTRWGPVLDELDGRPVAFDSTLLDPTALDFNLIGIYQASTVEEALAVVNDSGLPPVNVVAADAAGGIGWTVGGRFRRREQSGPRGLSPASAAAPDRLRPEELPRVVNPASGRIVNCNNATPANRAGLAWNTFNGHRAHRVARLVAAGNHDERDTNLVQTDTDAGFFEFYRELALQHLPEGRGAARLRELRRQLLGWDGTADAGQRGLPLLTAFRELLREELIAAATGPSRRYDEGFTYSYHGNETAIRQWLTELDGLVPPPWRDPTHFVVGQLLIAAGVLAHRAGDDRPLRWGEINRLDLIPVVTAPPSPRGGTVELDGCAETVRVALPDFGASMRLAVAPSRPEHGSLTIPGSPSADPETNAEHVLRWAAGKTHPLVPGS